MTHAVRIAALACFMSLAPLAAAQFGGVGAGHTLGRTLSTMQRMEPGHLEAATAAATAYQAQRQPVSLQSGLNDYRSILHAHAEDSSHTGGTRPEMLADAKRAGVSVILLSDHYRPPKDFITETWRGLHDGVLFIPGSECRGFLVYPEASIMDKMALDDAAFIAAVTAGDGLIFLSHPEARINHPMTGLTGMEAYNRHFDSMDDMLALLSLTSVVTDAKRYAAFAASLERYPAAMLATQLDYSDLYLGKWDREALGQRVVGIAANDCHHNMVIIAKVLDAETLLVGTIVDKDEGMRRLSAALTPAVRDATAGRQPGEIVARLDFDPYYQSFLNVSTHILAPELTEPAVRKALKAGHAYMSHDWMCDPSGFVFAARKDGEAGLAAIMGDETPHVPGLQLVAEFPVACDIRLLKDGDEVAKTKGREFVHRPDGPGVYRLEGWLHVDGEDRIWVYANPIYVR